MKRRNFIKSSLAASAGVVLASCDKEEPSATQAAYSGNVAIIGAGAAGLYAGYLLKQKNVKFTIYEASDRIGGRVRSLKGFSDFDIELGAEEIRGKNSEWYNIIKSTNATFVGDTVNNYVQIGGVVKTESQWLSDTDYTQAIKTIDGALTYTGTDVSLQTFMNANRLASRVQPYVASKVANRRGTSTGRLGLKGATEEAQLWSAGNESFYVANRSLYSILEEKFKDIIPNVTLNTPIARIDYTGLSDQGVIIEDIKGQRATYDKVIITVPLSILKAADLKFNPALPQVKTDAMARLGMDSGMKIILEFNKAFWSGDTGSIFGQYSIPEFSVTSLGRSKTANIMVAYINGPTADIIARQGAAALTNILAELDSIYGKGNASSNLKNAAVFDWLKDTPYIKGAMSYPLVGGGVPQRQELSRPVLKKLYFAGEATHYGGHGGTVHGAIESAQRAVTELLQEIA